MRGGFSLPGLQVETMSLAALSGKLRKQYADRHQGEIDGHFVSPRHGECDSRKWSAWHAQKILERMKNKKEIIKTIGSESAPERSMFQTNSNESMHLVLPGVRVAWTRLKPGEKGANLHNDRVGGNTCRLIFCIDCRLDAKGFRDRPRGSLQIASGCCGFVYNPDGCRCLACAACGNARVVEVRFSCRSLLHLMGQGNLSRALRLAESRGRSLEAVIKITPAMGHILRLLEDHAAERQVNPLFIMAKTLELMWLFADGFEQSEPGRINGMDRRAVNKAQTLLESNMADPPSLRELAGHVGMSLSKLKQVFPRVCGRPPYAYLRRVRMERALYLIRSTDMSMIEVAFEVGYASPSRFSRAFAEQFGFKPSEARRRR